MNTNTNANPVARKYASGLTLTSKSTGTKCYMDIAGISSDTDSFETRSPATSSTTSTKFNHSNDSLSSFEDYRAELSSEPPATFVYFKCAIPTSQASCTSDFIAYMCCNCGRGGGNNGSASGK